MAAPHGNQYALGNKGGAPRTVSPPPEECILLGEELVKWATEPVPKNEKRLHLNQWWALVKKITKNEWDTLCERKEFIPYYEKAKVAISIRYIDGTINPSISQRFLRLYFSDLKQDEDEVADRKNKANAQALTADEIIKAIREDMNARTKSQSVRGVPAAPEPDVADK